MQWTGLHFHFNKVPYGLPYIGMGMRNRNILYVGVHTHTRTHTMHKHTQTHTHTHRPVHRSTFSDLKRFPSREMEQELKQNNGYRSYQQLLISIYFLFSVFFFFAIVLYCEKALKTLSFTNRRSRKKTYRFGQRAQEESKSPSRCKKNKYQKV